MTSFFKKRYLLLVCRGAVVGDDLPGHTVVGCNNIIGHHAMVGIKCQDMKYKVCCKSNVFWDALNR